MDKKPSENFTFYNASDGSKDKPSLGHFLCKTLLTIGAAITFIRNLVCNVLFIIVLAMLFGLFSFIGELQDNAKDLIEGNFNKFTATKDPSTIQKQPVIYVSLAGPIYEKPFANDEFSQIQRRFSDNFNAASGNELEALENLFKEVSSDQDIKEVILDFDNMSATSAQVVLRLKDAIRQVTSKPGERAKITSVAANYSQAAYAIASSTDKIVLDPMGQIDFKGVGINSLYFGDLLEKFKVEPLIFKEGTFKSATETFTSNKMSDGVKAEYQLIADELWDQYLQFFQNRPGVSDKIKQLMLPGSLSSNLKKYGGSFAVMDYELGLVDEIASKPNALSEFGKSYGFDEGSTYMPKSMSISDYLVLKNLDKGNAADIVVVYGLGDISADSDKYDGFTSASIVPILDGIAADSGIKAVVFYINSGGGSVEASEDIRRALQRVKDSGKKVVISMNGLCASGAYWISSAADYIMATENTITGSIGVFSLGFGFDKLLNEYGVTQDGVATSDFASNSVASPLPAPQKDVMQQRVSFIYGEFLKLVSSSRTELKTHDPNDFAQGKVFLAEDALNLGLIDGIGSFHEAVKEAAKLSGIEHPTVQTAFGDSAPNLGSLQKLLLSKTYGILPDFLEKSVWQSLIVKSQLDVKANSMEIMAISPCLEIKY